MAKARVDVRENGEVDFGLIRLYALYRATITAVSSSAIAQEMTQRGVRISPASTSQILRGLLKRGYIAPRPSSGRRRSCREYLATPSGRGVMNEAGEKLRDLMSVGFQ